MSGLSPTVLPGLLKTISDFVNGSEEDTVLIGGDHVKTIKGIAAEMANRKFYQYLLDYRTLAAAQNDVDVNPLLTDGKLIRVYGEVDPRINGLYELTTSGLVKTDVWELYDFFNMTKDMPYDYQVKSTSLATLKVFSITIENPLTNQSKYISADLRIELDSFDAGTDGKQIANLQLMFGIDSTGTVHATVNVINENSIGVPAFTGASFIHCAVLDAVDDPSGLDPTRTEFTIELTVDTLVDFNLKTILTNIPKAHDY